MNARWTYAAFLAGLICLPVSQIGDGRPGLGLLGALVMIGAGLTGLVREVRS